jgi:hypothetical protein
MYVFACVMFMTSGEESSRENISEFELLGEIQVILKTAHKYTVVGIIHHHLVSNEYIFI